MCLYFAIKRSFLKNEVTRFLALDWCHMFYRCVGCIAHPPPPSNEELVPTCRETSSPDGSCCSKPKSYVTAQAVHFSLSQWLPQIFSSRSAEILMSYILPNIIFLTMLGKRCKKCQILFKFGSAEKKTLCCWTRLESCVYPGVTVLAGAPWK